MLLLCPRAWEVWSFFFPDFSTRGPSNLADLWTMRSRGFEETTVVTAIAWNIWKRRNAWTFNGVSEGLPLVSHRCIEDIRLWAHRCTTPSPSLSLNNYIDVTGSTCNEPPLSLRLPSKTM
jgi:hypothetical protein